ncbi:MAG TPA: hypothetical protein VK926_00460, partial [Gaiellaceae bacterium]|nr:hypothetical protein [Gaiellaceae bacterium]
GGEWDDALRLGDLVLAAPERFRYMEHATRQVRANVFNARGDADSAMTEIRRALARARQIDDAQSLWPLLGALAGLTRRQGLQDERDRALDEVLAAFDANESVGDAQEWHPELVLELVLAGLSAAATRVVEQLPDVPWRDVARAIVDGDHAGAADLLESIGEQPLQAELRLRAARSLAAEGRLADAEAQLERARAFYRSVGATAYLREADEILAAAS